MLIIQLSDIHRSNIILERLGELASSADLIVVSGDVTTFGEEEYFRRFMDQLSDLKAKVLYVPGNNDLADFDLPEGIINIDSKKIQIGGYMFGGLGGSPPTPFNTPNEIPEEVLKERLESLGRVDVLVSHTPPIDTAADRLNSGGHAGSTAVREYVLSMKPRLVLCGHVHEAIAKIRLGESLVINPGSASSRRYARIKMNGEILATLSTL